MTVVSILVDMTTGLTDGKKKHKRKQECDPSVAFLLLQSVKKAFTQILVLMFSDLPSCFSKFAVNKNSTLKVKHTLA